MAYSAIDNSSEFMNTVLWTGTNSGETISGVGFQPDLNWTKQRTGTEAHFLVDSVRGVEKTIYSDSNSAEVTESTGLTAFNSDGFVHGTDNAYCEAGNTFASWSWKMGTTSGIDATGATITPTGYSFNATAGQSIIKYTGTEVSATLPHGLGVVPSLIIIKDLENSNSWYVYHKSVGQGKALRLDTQDTPDTSSTYWSDTLPTSVLFTVGTNTGVNKSGGAMIAYCFANTPGYFKTGKYTGNGNADGPFLNCNFRPSFFILKPNSGEAWMMGDNKRANSFNPSGEYLYPNKTNAESTSTSSLTDYVSNGVKIRHAHGQFNPDGVDVYWWAFGQPIVSNSGVPCPAR